MATSLLLQGCRTPALVDPRVGATAGYPCAAEAGGVTLRADPYHDRSRVEATFGALLADSNVLPVRIRVENGSAAGMILQLDALGLRRGEGASLARVQGVARHVFSPIDLLGGAWVAATAKRVQGTQAVARMSQLALRSTTLTAGTSAEGFVYFEAADPAGDEPLALDLVLTVAGTPKAVELELVLP